MTSDVPYIVLAILGIVLVAQTFGALAKRFGQPSVAGEILAGVVLGPTVLG